MYQAISPESYLQFSQTVPHFHQNHKLNQIKPSNLKKILELRDWSLETRFEPLGSENFIKPQVLDPSSSFDKHGVIFYNHKLNPIKLSNLKRYLGLEI